MEFKDELAPVLTATASQPLIIYGCPDALQNRQLGGPCRREGHRKGARADHLSWGDFPVGSLCDLPTSAL